MSRQRVLLPCPAETEPLPYDQALAEPLAQQFGVTVDGVTSREKLHELLVAQGKMLLEGLDDIATSPEAQIERPEHYALRQLRVPHVREGVFVEGLDEHDQSLTVRIMYPYAPQYGYMQSTERALGRPLRMSFGLARRNPENGTYVVGHTNLWASVDRLSMRHGFMALKDTVVRKVDVETDEAMHLLGTRTRSRARAAFVIDSLLDN